MVLYSKSLKQCLCVPERVLCALERVLCSVERGWFAVEIVYCVLEIVLCVLERILCSVERGWFAVEIVYSVLEIVWYALEKVYVHRKEFSVCFINPYPFTQNSFIPISGFFIHYYSYLSTTGPNNPYYSIFITMLVYKRF